jgi:hypothetical protein
MTVNPVCQRVVGKSYKQTLLRRPGLNGHGIREGVDILGNSAAVGLDIASTAAVAQ